MLELGFPEAGSPSTRCQAYLAENSLRREGSTSEFHPAYSDGMRRSSRSVDENLCFTVETVHAGTFPGRLGGINTLRASSSVSSQYIHCSETSIPAFTEQLLATKIQSVLV